tara:strand:+ start:1754 stop:2128 length:375 start_codon:yes stop_codon:yes gene_type:complete
MRFNKFYFSIFFLFFSTFYIFSQEKIKESEKPILPISIYTTLDKSINFNSLFSINNQLNFSTNTFAYLKQHNLREGYFTIPLENIGKKPSMFIYETYMDTYQKRNLEKAFFKVSDLYLPYFPHK